MWTIFLLFTTFVITAEHYPAITQENSINKFPDDFIFGVATSSYQIEGGWDADGKGPSIWDHMLHEHPERSKDGTNGDVAADSYHRYEEDVAAIEEMGLSTYRFSISWPRILPKGDIDVVNQAGIDYYNKLIDLLLQKGITPIVTMYHWDLPQALQYLGGWTNLIMVDYFKEYARILFENFGDRVGWWLTFNEPLAISFGYSSIGHLAPMMQAPDNVGYYHAATTILLAHAAVYHLYNEHYRPSQKGKISIALNSNWYEPASTSPDDILAAERAKHFALGLFAHPIYSTDGDYPPVVRERVDRNSAKEGRKKSRLPKFSKEQIEYIKGTSDFFALNSYTTELIKNKEERDSGTHTFKDPSWPSTAFEIMKVVPWGFRKLLNAVSKDYPHYPIFVMENGFSDHGQIDDTGRIKFIVSYLAELLKAIHEDGVNVFGYMYWSLLDNFEWNEGFTQKFGLYSVDFKSPDRKRTPKMSSRVYADIAKNRHIPKELWPES